MSHNKYNNQQNLMRSQKIETVRYYVSSPDKKPKPDYRHKSILVETNPPVIENSRIQQHHEVPIGLQHKSQIKFHNVLIQPCDHLNTYQSCLKELSTKVRQLRQQNYRLKIHKQPKVIDQEDLIRQNQKLRMIIEQLKKIQNKAEEQLLLENKRLRDALLNFEKQYQILKKSKLDEKKNSKQQTTIRKKPKFVQADSSNKNQYNQNLQIYRRTIEMKQVEINEHKEINKKYQLMINSDRKIFEQKILNMGQKMRTNYEQMINGITKLQIKIELAEKQLKHLKFERAVRLQESMRKSKNIAEFSMPSKGDVSQEDPNGDDIIEVSFEKSKNQRQREGKDKDKDKDEQMKSMFQKIYILNNYVGDLEREKQNLSLSVRQRDDAIHSKIEKIIILENQLNKKQENKFQKSPQSSYNYTSQVRNIRQTLADCNISNFDILQSDFKLIIEQRNEINKEKGFLNKSVVQLNLELSRQKQKNAIFQQRCIKYEENTQKLRNKIKQMQTTLTNMQSELIGKEIKRIREESEIKLEPDGYSGLQWQKVVKNCIVNSVNRLENLQKIMIQNKQSEHV